MNFDPGRLMLRRHSHPRYQENHARSKIPDLINRSTLASRALVARWFSSPMSRASTGTSNQRSYGHMHMPEAVSYISDDPVAPAQEPRFEAHQATGEPGSSLVGPENVSVEGEDGLMADTITQFDDIEITMLTEPSIVSSSSVLDGNTDPFHKFESDNPPEWPCNGGITADPNISPGRTANAGGKRKASRSNTSPNMTSARPTSRVDKNTKRKTNDQKSDKTDSVRRRNRPPHGQDDDNGPNQRLACPFFKFDRVKHLNCLHFQLKRVKDVKQHIFRKHSFHCPNCFGIFPDNQKCEEHMREGTCPPNLWSRDTAIRESISEEQKKSLSSRTCSGRTEVQQWFAIWVTLFPDTRRQVTPYLATEVEEVILTVRELWARNSALALENLNSTVSSPSNMLASCHITEAGLGGNALHNTATSVDSLLGSLARVSIPDRSTPNTAFWGTEFSSNQWNMMVAQPMPLGTDNDGHFGAISEAGPWVESINEAVIRNEGPDPQPSSPTEGWSQSPSRYDDMGDEQDTEVTDSQLGLVGIDAMLKETKEEEGQASEFWGTYLVGRNDMDFAIE